MPNISPYSYIGAIPYTVHHIPLSSAAGIGMAGQQRQQAAVRLNFDFLYLVGLDNLDVRYRIRHGFPQVCELHGVARLQAVDIPEVIRTAPAPVSGNDAVGVIPTDGRGRVAQHRRACGKVSVGCTQIDRHGKLHSRYL